MPTGPGSRRRAQLATLAWFHWFNRTASMATAATCHPFEFEAAYYAAQQAAPAGVGTQ